MNELVKYDGFLPKNDGDSVALSLYRVLLSEAVVANDSQPLVILLVDVSGSMCCSMEALKSAIVSTVDLTLNQKITVLGKIIIITFESRTTVYRDFKDFDDLVDKVSRFCSCGGTCYSNPIELVEKYLKEQHQVITVMFSDGEPMDSYQGAVNTLKTTASQESLVFHAIGLGVRGTAETILRNLTTIGSKEGYYQGIGEDEIKASMNVLVSHLDCPWEVYIAGNRRTYLGFFVDSAEQQYFDATYQDVSIRLDNPNSQSFENILKENSFALILEALNFLLGHYVKTESFSFEQAINIVEYVQSLAREVENELKTGQRNAAEKITNERREKLALIRNTTGTDVLKRQSEIIAESTIEIQNVTKTYREHLRSVHEIKELSAQVSENLHKNENINASVSGEIMKTVSQFRDNKIALQRKNLGRFSSKLIEENKKFENIDELLQKELDELVKCSSIPVPEYFENYTDPLTLNNFEEIMLYKFGVFMLLITVERHTYGITAPHKTKIIEVGGLSSSVLDVMMNNESSSLIFDFRGMGSGNAAIPLWISELHWKKAKHVFGPFVGHAVTGNELEYTKLQGSTLLAIVLLHIRKQKSSEYNQELARMVTETLKVQLDEKKWKDVLNGITNSFESLNENKIPSVGIFSLFVEFIGSDLTSDKQLLLIAEEYRRRNKRRIEDDYSKLEASKKGLQKKCALLIRMFPKVFQRYLDVSPEQIIAVLNKKSMENYFVSLYGEKGNDLLESFNNFAQKTVGVLKQASSKLDDKQKIAIVLSVHKCVCFNWNALNDGKIPAGYSYDNKYPDLLIDWCKGTVRQNHEKELKDSEEILLLKLLQTDDKSEAETIIGNIKRDSHVWGALLDILFRTCKIDSATGLKRDEWKIFRTEKYKQLIERMSIPFHYELIMYCLYGSFKSEDWISSKMVWRPNKARRRRLKAMFPEAPELE